MQTTGDGARHLTRAVRLRHEPLHQNRTVLPCQPIQYSSSYRTSRLIITIGANVDARTQYSAPSNVSASTSSDEPTT